MPKKIRSDQIKAIVLTYDDNHFIADHMMRCYEKQWPNHPLYFLIPYQEQIPETARENVRYIKSPRSIRGTVLRLLEDVEKADWIYWCIDDHYPVRLHGHYLNQIFAKLHDSEHFATFGLNFCAAAKHSRRHRSGSIRKGEYTVHSGKIFIEITDYEEIWLHQFLRADVLWHLFSSIPDPRRGAKEMDYTKREVIKPPAHRLLMHEYDLALFSESTRRGLLTDDFVRSAKGMGIKIDESRLSHGRIQSITRGAMGFRHTVVSKINRCLRRRT